MIPPVNGFERFVQPDGRLTTAGMILLQELTKAVQAQEAKLGAIAAVAAPTGGGTVDAQSRAAISAIIAAAT